MTPGFLVINSNDLCTLAGICAQIITKTPLTNPLQNENIVVMSLGMRTYLRQEIALDNGIAAGLHFSQVWQLIWDLYRDLYPAAPGQNLYARLNLAWNIVSLYKVWNHKDQRQTFKRLQDYVKDDVKGLRRYALAAKLADAYDQYQMYRPRWILKWDELSDEDFELYEKDPTLKGKIRDFIEEASAGDIGKRKILENNVWQIKLWHLMRQNLKIFDVKDKLLEEAFPEGFARGRDDAFADLLFDDLGSAAKQEEILELSSLDRAQVVEKILKTLQGPLTKEQKAALPERIFIFGVSSLPLQVVQLLSALGRVSQVYLMLLNPCSAYWGDLSPSYKEDFAAFKKKVLQSRVGTDFKLRRKALSFDKESRFEESDFDDGLRVEGNSLLLSLGRVGQDLLSMLFDLNPNPQLADCFVDFDRPTLLGKIQSLLLTLEEGERIAVSPEDRSLEIRVCHTKRREVEVLKDAILRRFKEAADRGEKLLPRDVVVMVPAINDYAPYINAVFGSTDEDSEAVPYAISDRTTLEASPAARALLTLLDIGTHPLKASALIDLLCVEEIASRFNLTQEEVDTLASALQECPVFWGLDDADIKKESQISLPCSFEEGITKMMLGTMLGPDDEALVYSELEGQDALTLGKFYDFWEALRQLRETFTPQLKLNPRNWKEKINEELLLRFFERDDSHAQIAAVEAIIDDLIAVSLSLKQEPIVTLPVFRAMLEHALRSQRDYSPYLKDKVNFCSLVPMRAVPFKHVFILGLNDLDFPRSERSPGFNLMSLPHSYQKGDRSVSLDDRYLFLEALISAQESIYFSYLGQSPTSQLITAPSCVLSELIDYIKDHFVLDGDADSAALMDKIISYEHLSAYHEDNYRQSAGRIPSFDAKNCVKPSLVPQRRPMPGEQDDWGFVLEDNLILNTAFLERALKDPCRFFLRERLGFSADFYADDEIADVEPFTAGRFEVNAAALDLLYQEDGKADEYLSRQSQLGRLPYGQLTEVAVNEVRERYELLREGVRAVNPLLKLWEQEPSIAFKHQVICQRLDKTVTVSLSGQTEAHPVIIDAFRSPSNKSPGYKNLIAAFIKMTERYCTDRALLNVPIVLSGGNVLYLKAFEDMEQMIGRALDLYLTLSLRPLPFNGKLLEVLSSDKVKEADVEKAFDRDLSASYLFLNPRQIEEHPKLEALLSSGLDFYRCLSGNVCKENEL